jgi:hypothetical protein
LSLDALTRKHIRDNSEYRYVTVGNGNDAFALEREVQRGALGVGKPFLNPLLNFYFLTGTRTFPVYRSEQQV